MWHWEGALRFQLMFFFSRTRAFSHRRIFSMPSMTMTCPNAHLGCGWHGPPERQAAHVAECPAPVILLTSFLSSFSHRGLSLSYTHYRSLSHLSSPPFSSLPSHLCRVRAHAHMPFFFRVSDFVVSLRQVRVCRALLTCRHGDARGEQCGAPSGAGRVQSRRTHRLSGSMQYCNNSNPTTRKPDQNPHDQDQDQNKTRPVKHRQTGSLESLPHNHTHTHTIGHTRLQSLSFETYMC